MPKRAAAETYDSDGGFVEGAPKSKKSKGKTDFKAASKVSNGGGGGGIPSMQKDSDGGVFWEISGKRRLQVSDYRGKSMIGIREFYEKDGQMLPGKKGVSMTVEQYNAIVELLPQVEGVLRKKGEEVVRPVYGGTSKKKMEESEDGGEEEEAEAEESAAEEEEEEEEVVTKKTKSKLDKFKHNSKKNHEATSDEEEG